MRSPALGWEGHLRRSGDTQQSSVGRLPLRATLRYHCPVVRARTTVGRKGRTVIPVAARQAAGIVEGQELVVLTDAPGRLVLMTRDAIQAEVWRAADDMRSEDDVMAETRAMRREDNAISDAAEERAALRGAEPGDGMDAVGLELLRHLGINHTP